MFKRKGCLTGCLTGCLNTILLVCIVAGVWYYGTNTLTTTEVTLESDKISDDITFVQITDLHGKTFGEGNRDLLGLINDANPDFVVTTGDMYSHYSKKGKETAIDLMDKLAEDYSVYAVRGEHDADEEYEQILEDEGVDVLDYESKDIYIGSSMIRLYGISNEYYSSSFDLHNAFDIDKGVYNILAAHICNAEAFGEAKMDLTVSGDSHGGQIRLPYYGALINKSIWLPENKGGDAAYTKGMYKVGDTNVFISGGLGNYPIPVRFMNRPEIVVFHLKGKE